MKLNKLFLLENYFGNKAYWISPYGQIEEVKQRHINSVLDNPEAFGYTEQELDDVYKEFNEPKGHEGKAREKIMTDLMRQGWIRIRWNPKQFTWIVQTFDMKKRHKDSLQQWSKQMLSNSSLKNSSVYILPIKDGVPPSNYSLSDISNDILYTESEKKDSKKYILK